MAKKRLPPEILDYFKKEGSRGGKKAAASMTAEQRSARAQKAALALSPAERSERARKAVAAREAKRKRMAKS
jgi:hypothetical protein